jgi:hypothetical protein
MCFKNVSKSLVCRARWRATSGQSTRTRTSSRTVWVTSGLVTEIQNFFLRQWYCCLISLCLCLKFLGWSDNCKTSGGKDRLFACLTNIRLTW